MRSIRYALLRPVRSLVRQYLTRQNRKHMDYSFRFILNQDLYQANTHYQIAETFRLATNALSEPGTTTPPPTDHATVRIMIRERRVIKGPAS